ncbi:telokin-like protein [Spilosoma obliqua nucleopolyhedrosis virus]|uniref:Telokin-like peptide n=1 Tax=Hyphantria cunea nuclear polyhedrosis virus TaxID=28288 RepID=Q2NP03_NPVHC|nr:Telokin-like peptide [Hyphantria cunea nucleopolyhedrovirus]AUR45097.1 telokin-like protein [Spilosoma obliqua nucleopolyhedrosis virus]BAE72358.1 Telokin-like peptide [Hyphantria cunea nucleopolyhedrovirus]
MANTNITTSDIVVRARVLVEDDDNTVLEFEAENEHRLMKGAHEVHVVVSPELDALHNGPYNEITLGDYTFHYNLMESNRFGAQVMLFVKKDDIKIAGPVFRLHVWNSKKSVVAPPHYDTEAAPAEEGPVAERFGAESSDAPPSPKKQKLDEHEQN